MKKPLIKNLLPDYRFKKIVDIRPTFFSEAQLIIFDVDDTLIFSETMETKKEIVDWFFNIKRQYKCLLISNSRTIIKREKKILKLFECEIFKSRYKKPSEKLFEEIKKKYDFKNDKVFVVGDRIFTDILFGNLNGAKTILVHPLSGLENILIKLARKLEDFMLSVLKFFGYN